MILVVEATGTVGTEFVTQLAEARQKVRALVHNPGQASKFVAAIEVVTGDLTKPETLSAAFAGVDKAFVLYAPGPNMAELKGNAYDAAKKAGTRHIVKLSAAGIEADFFPASPEAMWPNESERRLRALGIAWTVLRPGPFRLECNQVLGDHTARRTISPDRHRGKDAPIDPRDIAAVAVNVFTAAGHERKTYELIGPELLNYSEVVQKISAVTGTPFKFVDVPEEAWRREILSAGFPLSMVDTLLIYFASAKAGRWYLTSKADEILGRPAKTFDERARDHLTNL